MSHAAKMYYDDVFAVVNNSVVVVVDFIVG